jgi:hypothetical protein
MQNADSLLFRCSSLGHLNPGSRGIADTVAKHLIDVYISAKYKRREELKNKYLDKGTEREEDAITLVSRSTKTMYVKNDVRLSNAFVTGEPDLFKGESIFKADQTLDTKCSWSMHTFYRAMFDKLVNLYYWQGVGYMWLTGAKEHTVCFCLVNGTPDAIMDEKKRLAWKMKIIDTSAENPIYKDACRQIERNHIFDMGAFLKESPWFELDTILTGPPEEWDGNVPMQDRIHSFTVTRKESDILLLQNRIIECRYWMNENLFKKAA